MFDTSECIKEVVNPPPGSPDDITVEDHSRRREASFDISSRFRPRTGGFYSGLTAEVTAIEMEDLSRHHDTSTKHTAVSTPPVSLTDLTKVGQQEEESIKAETVRDRVAVAVEPQQFDLRVDVHKNATQSKVREEQNNDENHRRFSNLSNLAQSLPSTSSSASALVPTVSGSFDYLTSDNNRRGRDKREKRQKSESVRRTQSALNNTSARLKSKGVEEASASANVEEEQQPLLMKRHQSLEEHRRSSASKTINLSSRSLDRCLEEKKKAVNTKVAKVKEEADFQTELEEATQALLIASQCKIDCKFNFENSYPKIIFIFQTYKENLLLLL